MRILISVFSLVAVALLFTMCKNTESSSGSTDAAEGTMEQTDSVAYVGADGKLVIPEQATMAVSDFAGVLGDSVRGLEDDLRMYGAQTPAQIVVVTISDIADADPQQIAAEIGKRWGVGKEKENGVVILVQPKTAHSGGKVAIAVGKGLEPMLNDVCCQGIISDIMLPKIRTKDYYGAVSAAVADLVRTISMMQQ